MSERITIRKLGAAGYPWMVVCPVCPGFRQHDDNTEGQRGINTAIGWRSWTSAVRVARRHVAWHLARKGATL